MSVEITPYFALDERYPSLIGVRADGDEYETAYVSKHELIGVMCERDELRELVRDMLDCIDIQIAFERVPARWMQDEFAGRARELGVEVDE